MGEKTTKRVAKNTIIMYVRLLVMTCISFYSSRLFLSTIGVEDYGILSVVGSISTSFVSVKCFFSESIQRFLNVAKGNTEDTISEQRAIFNLSLIIHLVLLIIIVICLELVGVWLLKYVLEIPEGRKEAAFFVFQMTIITTAIGILSLPYDAVIIANEKMGIYAGISVFNAVISLFYIIMLPYIGLDYLKTYSVLMLTIPLSTLLFQIVYCRRFEECKYVLKPDRELFKKIFVFSGWNFMGNLCFSLIHEGVNFLLNIYGGVVLNAARAIAYRLKYMMYEISSNALVAIRPLAMQKSVQDSKEEYFETIFMLSRMSFFLNIIPLLPLFIFCPQFLHYWLVEVPEYTVLFTRLILVALLIRSFHEPINIMNMALGKIKRMMMVEVVVMLLFLVLIYLSLKIFSIIWLPFAVLSVMEIFIIISLIINAAHELDFPYYSYIKKVVLPMVGLTTISSFLLLFSLHVFTADSLLFFIIDVLVVLILELIICYLFTNRVEKNIIKVLFHRL